MILSLFNKILFIEADSLVFVDNSLIFKSNHTSQRIIQERKKIYEILRRRREEVSREEVRGEASSRATLTGFLILKELQRNSIYLGFE